MRIRRPIALKGDSTARRSQIAYRKLRIDGGAVAIESAAIPRVENEADIHLELVD